jgi:calcineurin-like phosphoesterase family protein
VLRKYTYTHAEESKVFFTSDTHFCHTKLVAMRGFKTVEEHDIALLNNWNRVVRPQDTVIHLGDFVLGAGDKSKDACIHLFNRLNGHIILLWGNHLAGVKSIYTESVTEQHGLDGETYEVYPTTWNNKVTFVGSSMLAHIKTPFVGKAERQNHFVFCSHFAHRVWIDSNKKVLHASGHAHASDVESNPGWKTARRLDVGVDNFNFTPLGFDEFLRIMKTKTQTIIDHHSELDADGRLEI